jgi:hypothetical protein
MAKLTDLGFSEGIVTETILSTYNPDGVSNAAPMGATMQDPQTFNLNIFNSSQTNSNLRTNRFAVINVTSNIEFYYKTAFKEANPEGKLPKEWFEKAEAVNAPKLRLAEATIEVSVVNMQPVGMEKTVFSCNVEKVNFVKIFPQVYCRAMPATLEAIVHATRVKEFLNDQKKKAQVNQLLQAIQNCIAIVNRTAPNSAYSEVLADLIKRIDSWRNKP